jgi:Holliday junction resolvasome RuvABC endonuclease subunit
MNQLPTGGMRVLAIDPWYRGFGYAVLEGSQLLIDYGVRGGRGDKNSVCLRQIAGLMDDYRPDVVVIEDYAAKGSRRCERVRQLLASVRKLAATRKISIVGFSRLRVREVFAPVGARNKHQIASAIARQFPELARRLPPFRKCWMPEDPRTSIFDAVAFAIVLFSLRKAAAADHVSA